jgi:hypothetical protein
MKGSSMVNNKYCTEDILVPLKDIVSAYNSSCPSFYKYSDYNPLPYILTSTALLGVLLKKILLKVNGGYKDVHTPMQLVQSLSSLGVNIKDFTKEEIDFLELDVSSLSHDLSGTMKIQVNEEVVDGLFKYFLDLSLKVGVEGGKLVVNRSMRLIFATPQLIGGTYRAFIWEPGSVIVIPLVEDEESIYVESYEAFTKMLIDGEYDFNIGFDHGGGMKAVERMLRWGCEEVIM